MLFTRARSSVRNTLHGGGCNHTRHVFVIFICIWHDSVCSNVTTTTLCRKTRLSNDDGEYTCAPKINCNRKGSRIATGHRPSSGIYLWNFYLKCIVDIPMSTDANTHIISCVEIRGKYSAHLPNQIFFFLIKWIFNIANKSVDNVGVVLNRSEVR